MRIFLSAAMAKQSIMRIITPFRWDLLGFAFSRAWFTGLLAYSANLAWTFKTPIVQQIILYTTGAIVALFIALLARKHKAIFSETAYRIRALIFSFMGLIGTTCLILGQVEGNGVFMIAGFALAGICGGFYETVWGTKFTSLPSSGIQVYTLFAMAASSLIGIFLGMLPESGFHLASILLLVLFTVFFLLRPAMELDSDDVNENHQLASSIIVDAATQKRCKRALVNILVAYLIFSLIYNLVIALTYDSIPPATASQIRFWANFVTALLLLIFALALFRPIGPIALFRLILPITAVGFVIYLISPENLGTVALTISSCGRKFFDILTWILIARAVQLYRLLPERFFGLLIAGKNAGYAIGLMLASVALGALNDEVIHIVTFVPILLLALIVCFFWIFPERTLDALFNVSPPTGKAPSHRNTIERNALELAEERKLTPRETDVFKLLVQGRSLSVIAARLHIAKGTAHAHISHIYQKLDVHGQQELIELVENHNRPD